MSLELLNWPALQAHPSEAYILDVCDLQRSSLSDTSERVQTYRASQSRSREDEARCTPILGCRHGERREHRPDETREVRHRRAEIDAYAGQSHRDPGAPRQRLASPEKVAVG